MTSSTDIPGVKDIPGFEIDDSPDRPLYRPRVWFDRTPLAVREALRILDPDGLADFEREFHIAMAEADDDFDLSRVDSVVRFWHGRAVMFLDDEKRQYIEAVIARLNAGDQSDFAEEDRK